MEARNVAQDRNTGYLLNEICTANGDDLYTYNIGVEGHVIYTLANNINNALNKYVPTQYVIAETVTVELDIESMRAVLDHIWERSPAYDSGIIYYLQKIPYLRLLHHQLINVQAQHLSEQKQLENVEERNSDSDASEEMYETIDIDEYKLVLDEFLGKMAESVREQGCRLIIFYIPSIQIKDDGSLTAWTDEQYMQLFQSVCDEKEIMLVDMTDDFIKEYEENAKLPYGFNNTEIGREHLNTVGHELIANRLYKVITRNEE